MGPNNSLNKQETPFHEHNPLLIPPNSLHPQPQTSPATVRLPLPHLRSGRLVARPHGVVRPQQARVAGLVGARERDQARGAPAPAARDLDLPARQVELGAAGLFGLVQRDALDADQVLAAGDGLGDGEFDGFFVWGVLVCRLGIGVERWTEGEIYCMPARSSRPR